MANLIGLQKFINHMLEQHPDLADTDIAADHEQVYLAMPESEEETAQLIEKGKEFGLLIVEDDESGDSLIIFV